MRVIQLRCNVCPIPFIYVYNGVVSVDSRHNGHIHSNSINVELLLLLARITKKHSSEFGILTAQTNAGLSVIQPVERSDGWGLALTCHRGECNAPWAYLINGNIQITSWHQQEKHCNVVSYDSLCVLMGGVRDVV